MYATLYADVSREQLNEFGVKAGHQIKIMKKVKEEFDKLLSGKYDEPPRDEKAGTKVESGYGEADVNIYDEVTPAQEVSSIEVNSHISPDDNDEDHN